MDSARMRIRLDFGGVVVVLRSCNRAEREAAQALSREVGERVVKPGSDAEQQTAEERVATMKELGERIETMLTSLVVAVESEGEVFAEGEGARSWVYEQGVLHLWEDRFTAFQEVYFRGRAQVAGQGDGGRGGAGVA